MLQLFRRYVIGVERSISINKNLMLFNRRRFTLENIISI